MNLVPNLHRSTLMAVVDLIYRHNEARLITLTMLAGCNLLAANIKVVNRGALVGLLALSAPDGSTIRVSSSAVLGIECSYRSFGSVPGGLNATLAFNTCIL